MDLNNRSSLSDIYCGRWKFRPAGCWNEYKSNGKLEPEGLKSLLVSASLDLKPAHGVIKPKQHPEDPALPWKQKLPEKRVRADGIYWMLPIFFQLCQLVTAIWSNCCNLWLMSGSGILCLSWKCSVDAGMVSTKLVSRHFGRWLHCTTISGCPT